jgi:hypothetical protein
VRSTAALFLTACLALVPIATASAEPDLALRVEGYLGYSNLDVGFVDLDAFQGGGTGSVSVVFEQFYLQGDLFGDVFRHSLVAGLTFFWGAETPALQPTTAAVSSRVAVAFCCPAGSADESRQPVPSMPARYGTFEASIVVNPYRSAEPFE